MGAIGQHFKTWWWAYLLGLIVLVVVAYNAGWLKFGKLSLG